MKELMPEREPQDDPSGEKQALQTLLCRAHVYMVRPMYMCIQIDK